MIQELMYELLKELDWYFANRKGVCLPISYLSMLKRAVHILATTENHSVLDEAQSIIEKLRDIRAHNEGCEARTRNLTDDEMEIYDQWLNFLTKED